VDHVSQGHAPVAMKAARARYDADSMVASFAARLKDAVDLDSVRDDLTSVVTRALEPAQVWVWTRTPPGTG
jgi:hypothetical protein